MRQTVSDDASGEDDWIVYDYFDVTIEYECNGDVLSLSDATNTTYYEYQIDSGAVTWDANVAQTISGCNIDYTHEIWDETLQSWEPLLAADYEWLSADPASGSFDIDQAWSSTYVPWVDVTIRITYESTYSDEDDNSVSDQYVIRIGDVCRYDTLTKNSEFADWTYVIWSTQTSETLIPDYTQSNTACPLVATLLLFNEVTNTWVDSASAWNGYGGSNAFIAGSTSSVTSNVAQMTIDFQDPTSSPAAKPYVEWYAKITLEDQRSENSDTYPASLEWYFTLQLRDRCADDTLTLNAEIQSFNYTIDSGTLDDGGSDFGIDYTQLYAFTDSDYQCQIDATIEYWDSETYLSWVYDSTELAWVNGFDSNHGTFSVVTTDRSKYGIETEWNMRVTLNLPDSLMDDDEVTITDQFTVYLKDACADNELSIDDAN